MKHMLLCVSLALGVSLGAANSGHAFSIGEMKVQSFLHAPFVAEVPLHVKPAERGQEFVAVIGDESDYEAEGVTRLPMIETLRPNILLGPADLIRIVSHEPIETPAFDLLLLVRTGLVTIVKTYAVTLTPDPKSTPIVVEAPPPPETHEKAPAEAAWLANLPATYGPILPGEVLYKIMHRLQVPASYKWQVAVRLWEHNQTRFVRGNLHGLQVGVYLDIPPNLGDSLTKISPHDARQIVAEQWDQWQKPADMVTASTAPDTTGISQMADVAPTEPAPPDPMDVAPATDTTSPVNHATLESALQKFERRLEQRLMLPKPTANAARDSTLTFVSANELQTALQGLEARIVQRLETARHPAGAWHSDTASPPVRVGMETALASFLSADSFAYVFMAQNLILLAIAAGLAWRWYRKRI